RRPPCTRGCKVFTRPSSTSGNAVKLEISRTGTFSFLSKSAVPPVEIMSTPCPSSSRANAAIPVLSETEMRARVIFKAVKRLKVTKLKRRRTLHALTFQRFNFLTVKNDILGRRIKHRATADCFAKFFTKMTQARVTDFCRSLSDIVASRAQQFGSAFHSQVAQILRNGQSRFARK